jgi:REP element-mobilizing transposase RayT
LFPGAVYHVIARGNERRRIFHDESDCLEFLGTLEAGVERYGVVCHFYCLMGNHYHALIETPRANLPIAMRHLNGCYTQSFNRRRGRVGHLFQGRYRAILVEKDGHLLETLRYIALNPTRTRPPLCETPQEWRWSSYPAYLGLAPKPAWLHTDWALAQFAADRHRARQHLERFVNEGLRRHQREPLTVEGSVFFGASAFVRANTAGLEEPAEIPRPHWQPIPPTLDEIFASAPDPIATAYREYGYTLREIGEHLGRHYTTISRRLRQNEMRQRKT